VRAAEGVVVVIWAGTGTTVAEVTIAFAPLIDVGTTGSMLPDTCPVGLTVDVTEKPEEEPEDDGFLTTGGEPAAGAPNGCPSVTSLCNCLGCLSRVLTSPDNLSGFDVVGVLGFLLRGRPNGVVSGKFSKGRLGSDIL
jgi:hypothetical protein